MEENEALEITREEGRVKVYDKRSGITRTVIHGDGKPFYDHAKKEITYYNNTSYDDLSYLWGMEKLLKVLS